MVLLITKEISVLQQKYFGDLNSKEEGQCSSQEEDLMPLNKRILAVLETRPAAIGPGLQNYLNSTDSNIPH